MRAAAGPADPDWSAMPVLGTDWFIPSALLAEAMCDSTYETLRALTVPVLAYHGTRNALGGRGGPARRRVTVAPRSVQLVAVNEQESQLDAGRASPHQPALELSAPPMGFAALVRSDYEALLVERSEPRWRSALMYLPRLLLSPSLQLAFLVRVAQKGPLPLVYASRLIQITLFKCEICEFKGEEGIQIGPAVGFPHPWCIIIGRGTKIGAGVTIYNNTGIGADRHLPHSGVIGGRAARLGDRSVVYAYCAIQGPYVVGHDAVVGIHVVLDEDVPPGALKSYRRMRLAGEWPGEGRARWRPARDGLGSS